jgi:hypothetical protein
VNSKRRALCCVALAALCLVGCRGLRTYKSSNWEVIIEKAGYQKNFEYETLEPPSYSTVKRSRAGLVVRMTIRYIGRDGSAVAPDVLLKRGDQTIRAEYQAMEGIFSSKEDKQDEMGRQPVRIGKDPATGAVVVAKVDDVFPVPDDNTEYLLAIGDLAPIRVRP